AMETLLRHWGLTVTSHADAQSVLALGVEGIAGTDLLLSDYHLEGPTSGLELIISLREQGMYDGATALITADTSNDHEDAARQADVTVIYKPVLPARLRRAVQGLLSAVSGWSARAGARCAHIRRRGGGPGPPGPPPDRS